MLNARQKSKRSLSWSQATAPLGRPGARIENSVPEDADAVVISRDYMSAKDGMHELRYSTSSVENAVSRGLHPLTSKEMNSYLYSYESSEKSAFDEIETTINEVSKLQAEADFKIKAQAHIRERLGVQIPESIVFDTRNHNLDIYIRKLYARCLFEVYRRYCNSFKSDFPNAMGVKEFQSFIQDCGFHTVDVSPCADGRLAHVISYVLRLPYSAVRRKSYAGAMFDVEDTLDKWVETELKRFREGYPNTSDAQTRYLKVVIYHFSSLYPDKEGCAAHGSNAEMAAKAGKDRLHSFKQAVENTYCCGASIDELLIGLNTDNDSIRIHIPDERGELSLTRYIDASEIYKSTHGMSEDHAKNWIIDFVVRENSQMSDGLVKFISFLLINNISQIDYVHTYHGDHYDDIGHAERFIGVGKGFEEVQLRNLTFFSYLKTVEESASDLDVGIKIFKSLNVSRGLPIPVIIRFDYHGNVPGSRERAIEHCHRVNNALNVRYEDLVLQGLLHTMMAIKDVNTNNQVEVLGSSVSTQATQEAY